jgi:serine O-acetyltransferase
LITLRQTITAIKNDLPQKKPGLLCFFKNYIYNCGFRVLLNHRIGKYFFFNKFPFFRQIGLYYKVKLITKRNCDISYKAIIGANVRFPHPLGIVIGEGVVIKDNVKIWQQVTLGSHGKEGAVFSYPILNDNVKVFVGAKVLGGISIGENAIIGANSVVLKDVPSNTVVVGIPARIIGTN